MTIHLDFKRILIFLLIGGIVCLLSRCAVARNLANRQITDGLLVWSIDDCNGIQAILGTRVNSIIDENRTTVVLPIDSIDNDLYFGLEYPYQYGDMVYFTTTSKSSGKSCIISKMIIKPDWSEEATEYPYYRRSSEWKVILSSSGLIKHKKVIDDTIYYVLEDRERSRDRYCEIRKYTFNSGIDELLVSDVMLGTSFDVNHNEQILYINTDSEIVLLDKEGSNQSIGNGYSACFLDNTTIVASTEGGIKNIDLTNGDEVRIVKKVKGSQMVLSPSTEFLAVVERYENAFGIGVFHHKLTVVDLKTKKSKEVKVASTSISSGFAWFNDYYPFLY